MAEETLEDIISVLGELPPEAAGADMRPAASGNAEAPAVVKADTKPAPDYLEAAIHIPFPIFIIAPAILAYISKDDPERRYAAKQALVFQTISGLVDIILFIAAGLWPTAALMLFAALLIQTFMMASAFFATLRNGIYVYPIIGEALYESHVTTVILERTDGSIITNVDRLLELIKRSGTIRSADAAVLLNAPAAKIEEWAKMLEDGGLVEIRYQPIKGFEIIARKDKQ